MAVSAGETENADDSYEAFLDILQSCGSAFTTDLKNDKQGTKQNGEALQSKKKPALEKSSPDEDNVQLEAKNKSTSEPTRSEKDDGDDGGGFLEFLSFVYDVPLEREEPNDEDIQNEVFQGTELQKENERARTSIVTESSANEQPQEETVIVTSKKIMQEIMANEEDADRQKNKFILMELGMLFSLAGVDEHTGGACVMNIFGCLKNDFAKKQLISTESIC